MSSQATVLIVDDEKYVRESLATVLGRKGYTIRSADNVAMALAPSLLEGVDAIITDLRMPGQDGLTLIRNLKQGENRIPVIVLTGHGSVPSAVECIKAGAFDYLVKPSNPESLILALERALNHTNLRRELEYLRVHNQPLPGLVGGSREWKQVLETIETVAPSDSPVLLTGETGTGKGELAKFIHQKSSRSQAPFVQVNCAAIPLELFESEFFGHRRGAFTGAVSDREGRFRVAHRGTLLLDEISSMPEPAQAKVLRVLQDGTFERVGDSRPTSVDIRLVAAGNADLEAEVNAGRFRADLFYRINVWTIHIPPLRERRDDIQPLAEAFLEEFAARFQKTVRSVHPETLAILESYPWPGNVRELRNVIERSVLLEKSVQLLPSTLPFNLLQEEKTSRPADLNLRANLQAEERRLLEEALRRSRGVKRKAAQLLGIDERNLGYFLRKHGRTLKGIPVLFLALVLAACHSGTEKPDRVSERPAAEAQAEGKASNEKIRASHRLAPTGPLDIFTDITEGSGVKFVHFNDASARRYLPETMGSGAAFFDYDGDGRPDLYLVNGSRLVGDRSGGRVGALYRNLGGGKFGDVTQAANLNQSIYGMGAAVGDIDNDGHVDLLVTGVGSDRLYRNRGDGAFEDVTRRMGLNDSGFSSSAAFLDYDRDGFLDLFLGRYVKWNPESDVHCSPDGRHRTYCTPEVYPGASNRLYRNVEGKRFEDVTRSSGIFQAEGKTLGVVALDSNRDGWPDLAIANDTVRNFLFINNRDGTFSENGVVSGMAYSESGATRGGMGIDAADVDGDGHEDVAIGNFSQEMSAFYRASGHGFFVDEAAQAGLGLPTLMTLAFGTLWMDFDNDGRLDLVISNGHIEPEISQTQKSQTYAQPLQLFHHGRDGRFSLLRARSGVEKSPLSASLVGRGLASADIDGDGDLDLVVTQNGRSARLFRNNADPQSWLRIQLVGRKSNRSGYGALVRAVARGRKWERRLVSGRSYLSACEPILTLGFGEIKSIEYLEVTWPSGIIQKISRPPLNRLMRAVEPDTK